jgi:hypothetical protein
MAQEMVAASREFPPSSSGDAAGIAVVRARYAREAEPIGTVPPGDGANARTTLFLDKLGERLAFECAGTRLYDALISKHDAGRSFRGGPSREDLVHIRDEEHEHFALVAGVIDGLGGDPTAVTPSADLQAVASKGVPAVLADPRTDVLQCLEAIAMAELVDNDCWPALIELAEMAGRTHVGERFGEALAHEREHLERVRGWLAAGMGRSAERARAAGLDTRREPSRAATGVSRSGAAGRGRGRRAESGSKRGRDSRRSAPPKKTARGKAKTRRRAR